MGIGTGALVREDGVDMLMVIVRAVNRARENVWLDGVSVGGAGEKPGEYVMSFGV